MSFGIIVTCTAVHQPRRKAEHKAEWLRARNPWCPPVHAPLMDLPRFQEIMALDCSEEERVAHIAELDKEYGKECNALDKKYSDENKIVVEGTGLVAQVKYQGKIWTFEQTPGKASNPRRHATCSVSCAG